MIESGIDYRELYKSEKEKNADLLAKVSEQQREIERLREIFRRLLEHCTKTNNFNQYDGILGEIKFALKDSSNSSQVSEQEKEIEKLKIEYKSLRLSVQRFHQTLIARNYNNIGVWHNERQQYNFELITEVETILTSKT